jgi:hypothetical protein
MHRFVPLAVLLTLSACSSGSRDANGSATTSGGGPSGGTGGGSASSGGSASTSGGGQSTGGAAGGLSPEPGCTASGMFAHGEIVTLSCESGFGEHPDFSPDPALTWQGHEFLGFRFKDFEDGAIESQGFSVEVAPEQWSVETSVCPQGSAHCAKRVYLADERGALEAAQQGTTGRWYATFKMRASNELQSGKFFRIWGSDKNFWFSTGCDDLSIRGAPEYMQGETVWRSPSQLTAESWHRVEITADEAGAVSTYLDGQLQWSEEWITPPFGADGHTIDIGHMMDEPGALRCPAHPAWDGATYYDDIFYDFTVARFEVADAPVWDDRTASEVQIPVSWSDASVSFAVNQGEHVSLAGKYLFFVDATGSATLVGKIEPPG